MHEIDDANSPKFTLFNFLELVGICLGAGLGGILAYPFGFSAAAVGGLLGAPVGYGLTWLHAQIAVWIVGSETPEDDIVMTRFEERITTCLYASGIWVGLFSSWMGTFFTVFFLFDSRVHEPPEMSRGECIALGSSMIVCGYVLLWATQRLLNWYLSRCRERMSQ